ncbi:hypothetical protein D3C87_1263140 [compost metagenome]
MVTQDGPYEAKYSNATRNRFIVKHSLGGEGYQSIQIEKFAPGKEGIEDKIIQAKLFHVPFLPKVKEFVDNISKKSVEATYGCCSVSNIKWADSAWTFDVKKDKKAFSCKVSDIESKDPKVTCRE